MLPTLVLLIFCSFLHSAGKSKVPGLLLVHGLKENCSTASHEVQVLFSFPTTCRIEFTHFLLFCFILKHNRLFNKYMTEIKLFALNYFRKLVTDLLDPSLKHIP